MFLEGIICSSYDGKYVSVINKKRAHGSDKKGRALEDARESIKEDCADNQEYPGMKEGRVAE